ncbi:XRE family transcriptional regulator [Pseudoduganella sp. UC29_71]|uniref:XRE family transcriptional regulator n=1 Tax=Pseudoduganella sp. UC29_71 TaxID=3350174 RepID=UPI003671FF46
MTYDELQRHIGKAGLKSNEFARLVGMNPISVSNMRKRSEVSQHVAVVAVLLGEMAERGIDFREVLSRAGIAPLEKSDVGTGD